MQRALLPVADGGRGRSLAVYTNGLSLEHNGPPSVHAGLNEVFNHLLLPVDKDGIAGELG